MSENLRLEEFSAEHKKQFAGLCAVWEAECRKHIPGSGIPLRAENFEEYYEHLQNCRSKETCKAGMVPGTVYCLVNESNQITGLVSLRLCLNEQLLVRGGNIGYWVHPDFRRRGYAKRALALVLEKCPQYGLQRVLITCDKENVGSAKTILSSGGVLENEIELPDGTISQRYWVEIKEHF